MYLSSYCVIKWHFKDEHCFLKCNHSFLYELVCVILSWYYQILLLPSRLNEVNALASDVKPDEKSKDNNVEVFFDFI